MARNRTLNPHSFLYGSFHYYLVLAAMVPPYLAAALFSTDELVQKTVAYVAARGLSATMGTGCVLLTFLLGRTLFGTTSGLIAALFLALCMGLVNVAHFATVDVPALFWMMLSFLMSSYVLSSGDRRWYILAGILRGLRGRDQICGRHLPHQPDRGARHPEP